MRCSFACIAATFVAALAVSGAVPARAQQLRKGTVIVPPSNVVPPQYRGKRAHTNFLIFKPAKGGLVGTAPAGETPSSLACVYQVGGSTSLTSSQKTNCPVDYGASGSSTMNYDNPTGGSNMIAIVDAYNYPSAQNDFDVFSKEFGLPLSTDKCADGNDCFSVVWASGTQPKNNSSWAQEEALDIEWSHAMAPHAQIVLVEAASNSNTDLMQAVNVASQMVSAAGGGEVSMSWGSSESSSETSYDSNFTESLVTYFASSGDSGGKVIWPSASPYVVSAGGTTVNRTNGDFTGETTWSSAGGGPSSYEPMPLYQDITKDINTTTMRGTPDISFDANPSTGVSVYDSTASQGLSGWLVFGGTSVASPSLAGIANSAATSAGTFADGSNTSVQNSLYSNYAADASSTTSPGTCKYTSATPFYDITSGSAAGTYNPGPCWDFASGIGTPRGLTGLTGSTSTTAPFSLSASPTSLSVTPGSSTDASQTSTITVTPGTYTGTVYLTATAPTGSGLTAVVSPSSNSDSSQWTSTLTVTAGSTAVAGTYTVTVAGAESTSGSTVSSTSVTVTVNSPGSFKVSTTSSSYSVTLGGTAITIPVTVTSSGGFAGSVALSVTGLPNNVSGSFKPTSVTISSTTSGNSTLTLTPSSHGPAKTYTLTITGTGTSGSTNSTQVTLTVIK